jgi:hypothetical protein
MTTATSSTESFLFDEVTSAIAWLHALSYTPLYPLLVTQRPSDKYREQVALYGSLGTYSPVSEGAVATEMKPVQQYTKQFTHQEYKGKTPVTERVLQDEDWGYAQNIARMHGDAIIKTLDQNTASEFNGGWDTTTTADGLSLVNNSHTTETSASTFDNSITDALDYSGLDAGRQNLRNTQDDTGQYIDANLDALLVGTALETTALELIQSAMRPDNANMAANVFQGTMDLIVWNRFTKGDAYWYGFDKAKLMANSLMLMRIAPVMRNFGNVDSGTRYFGGYFRYTQGFVDWRGVVGSDGTA